jgi:CheY-like chemotaxis protein
MDTPTNANIPDLPVPVRVLIAEDDPMIANVMERLLQRQGISNKAVSNGREALQYLQANQVEVVITDILMPEMDGYELIPKLRKTSPNIRILAMTGNAPQFAFDMHHMAKMLGADRVIGKPFELPDLLKIVNELLAAPPRQDVLADRG